MMIRSHFHAEAEAKCALALHVVDHAREGELDAVGRELLLNHRRDHAVGVDLACGGLGVSVVCDGAMMV